MVNSINFFDFERYQIGTNDSYQNILTKFVVGSLAKILAFTKSSGQHPHSVLKNSEAADQVFKKAVAQSNRPLVDKEEIEKIPNSTSHWRFWEKRDQKKISQSPKMTRMLLDFAKNHKKGLSLALAIGTIAIAYFFFSRSQAQVNTSFISQWLKEATTIESGDTKSPILMFTSYTKENAGRLSMSQKVAQVHRDYCKNQGLHHLTFERNLADNALPYWSKIAGLKAMVEAPEFRDKKWFAWLDDDMVITDHNVHLNQLIQCLRSDDHLIVTEDAVSRIWQHIPLNTGFILVRNGEKSLKILNDLWEMRNDVLNDKGHTYANCPAQSCLHEQQALTKLLSSTGGAVKVIAQRFLDGIGINTFSRFSHYDVNRKMKINYGADPEYSKWSSGDFMAQCTGLATLGKRLLESGEYSNLQENLRAQCIDQLIKKSVLYKAP